MKSIYYLALRNDKKKLVNKASQMCTDLLSPIQSINKSITHENKPESSLGPISHWYIKKWDKQQIYAPENDFTTLINSKIQKVECATDI